MKKAVHQFIVIGLIALMLVLLVGKNHYLLGTALNIVQYPIVVLVALIFWRRSKRGIKLNYKILFVIGGLLILNWCYEHARRIDWSGSSNVKHEVSILTYNLFFKNKYKQKIIDEIRKHDPDVLVVQELTESWNLALTNQVYSKYKYRRTYVNNGTHGLGIFSKYPIQSCDYIDNGVGLPVFQVSKIKVKDRTFICTNGHPASPAIAVENPDKFFEYYSMNYKIRTEQWEKLNTYLETHYLGQPSIVAGDLNTMNIEPLYNTIRHDWLDLFSKEGEGWSQTFPNTSRIPAPILTLDYILYQGNIKPKKAKVLKGSSSDHFALLGEVEI